MRKSLVAMGLVMWGLVCCMPAWAAEGQGPAEGGPLPKIVLSAPKDAAQVAYLGLGSKKEFTVADIPAEVVIVQIFNMY